MIDIADEDHQPLKIVNANLARLIDRIPARAIINAADVIQAISFFPTNLAVYAQLPRLSLCPLSSRAIAS